MKKTLFDEVTIGGVTFKNRIAVAPMGTVHDDDGGMSRQQADYLLERAKGGFGIIYPAAVTVTDKWECPLFGGGNLHSPSHMMRLKTFVDEAHMLGAKVVLQITPGYGRVHAGPPGYTNHISASENSVFKFPEAKCHALTVDEIKFIMQKTTEAAGYAAYAGVDVLEIHSYGGYLIDQFMSPMWNRRTDEYGGTFENRMRFFNEFVAAVRAGVGPNFPLSVKFTPEHTIPGGRTFDGEGLKIAKMMDEMGFIFMHVDNGCYEAWYKQIPSAYDEEGSKLPVAVRLRNAGIKMPLLIDGKLNNPVLAKHVIESGISDLIALGHQSLADPYWPKKVKAGEYRDINYCIACNECVFSGGCSINPQIFHEVDWQIKPPKKIRKILVVGGGPGGMFTAALAAKQGHNVTLWEKDINLGGLARGAAGPDFKFDMQRYLEHLKYDLDMSGVKVSYVEANEENIDRFGADVVILACGAKTVVPPISGIDSAKVVSAFELLANNASVGKDIVVLGGGHVGCEAALDLHNQGRNVTIVEAADTILPAPMATNSYLALKKAIEDAGITCLPATKMTEINESGVKLSAADGEVNIKCDNVILAVGFKPEHSLKDALKNKPYSVFTLGDYNASRNIKAATAEGFQIVRLLDDLTDI